MFCERCINMEQGIREKVKKNKRLRLLSTWLVEIPHYGLNYSIISSICDWFGEPSHKRLSDRITDLPFREAERVADGHPHYARVIQTNDWTGGWVLWPISRQSAFWILPGAYLASGGCVERHHKITGTVLQSWGATCCFAFTKGAWSWERQNTKQW